LDVRMPGMSGLELQEELLRRGHTIPLVFVTAHGDVRSAVTAMKLGAVDFVVKPLDDDAFLDAVRAAIDRNGPAFHDRSQHLSAAVRLATLSQREGEVLKGIVGGKSNKAVADELGISVRTVEAHRAKVMEKTGTT